MKNKIITYITITIIILLIVVEILLINRKEQYKLDIKYYQTNSMIDIESKELETLIEEKSSFILFVHQPLCVTSYEFNKVVNEFKDTYQISLYKITFNELKETSLKDKIKYYPSIVLFKNGKIVDYLESDKDEHIEYYKSATGLTSWIENYVVIEKPSYSINNNTTTSEEEIEITDTKLENITYDENKVNIYFFWGNGCSHCKKAKEFFKNIEEEYGKLYNLHMFEVWYNKKNEKLLEQFATKLDKEVKGVPFIIIGNEVFEGFNEKLESNILKSILKQYQNSYDVNFDD